MITVHELRHRPRLGVRPVEPRRRVLISTERLVNDPEMVGQLCDSELSLPIGRLGRRRPAAVALEQEGSATISRR